MAHFRLVMISGALAVLTWIVADQSLTDTVSVRAKIVPVAAGGAGMRVSLAEEGVEPFELRLTGKKSALATLKAREPISIRLPIGNRPSGVQEVRLAEEIESDRGELAGLLVQEVVPPTLRVTVDHEVTTTFPVQVERGTLDYDGPVTVEPSTVTVRMSELAYEKLTPESRRITVNPDEYARSARRGVLVSVNVPLNARIGQATARLNPDVAKIHFKLKDNLQEATLSAVPIKIETSLDIFNEYNIEVGDNAAILTQPIRIKGRPEVVERIRAGDIRIVGVVSLTAADKAFPGKYRYFTPRFTLPEGVELIGTPEPIEIRLVPRAPNGGPVAAQNP